MNEVTEEQTKRAEPLQDLIGEGIFTPDELNNDTRLSRLQRFMLSLLIPHPFASNKSLAKALHSSATTISKARLKLRRIGLILKSMLSSKQIKEMVVAREGKETCEWCKGKAWSLHEHHYPKSKRDGGKDTVFICGTCHSDYHHIQSCGTLNIEWKENAHMALQQSGANK